MRENNNESNIAASESERKFDDDIIFGAYSGDIGRKTI